MEQNKLKPNKLHFSIRRSIVLFNLLFLIMIIIAFIYELYWEGESTFDSMLTPQLVQVQSKLESYADILYSLRGAFLVQNKFTQEKWDVFISSLNLAERHNIVGDLNYVEKTVDGNSQIHYINKYTNSESNVLGVDLATIPTRLEAIDRAVDQNTIASTSVVLLLSKKEGFVLFLPVYKYNYIDDGTVKSREDNLQGLVSMALPSSTFIDRLFSQEILKDFGIHMQDAATGEVLYHQETAINILGSLSREFPVSLGGRQWDVTIRIARPYFVTVSERLLLGILIVGGLYINLLVIFILRLQQRAAANGDNVYLRFTR